MVLTFGLLSLVHRTLWILYIFDGTCGRPSQRFRWSCNEDRCSGCEGTDAGVRRVGCGIRFGKASMRLLQSISRAHVACDEGVLMLGASAGPMVFRQACAHVFMVAPCCREGLDTSHRDQRRTTLFG